MHVISKQNKKKKIVIIIGKNKDDKKYMNLYAHTLYIYAYYIYINIYKRKEYIRVSFKVVVCRRIIIGTTGQDLFVLC